MMSFYAEKRRVKMPVKMQIHVGSLSSCHESIDTNARL